METKGLRSYVGPGLLDLQGPVPMTDAHVLPAEHAAKPNGKAITVLYTRYDSSLLTGPVTVSTTALLMGFSTHSPLSSIGKPSAMLIGPGLLDLMGHQGQSIEASGSAVSAPRAA